MAAVLYVVQGSEACAALQRRLEDSDEPVVVLDLTARPELVPELVKLTGGRRIAPVLVQGGRIVIAPDGGDTF